MKHRPVDWDWEKKPKRVEKGTNKAGKHRKSLYNMLSEVEDDYYDDDNDGTVRYNYSSNVNYTKQR
jgi:hypothetical protein